MSITKEVRSLAEAMMRTKTAQQPRIVAFAGAAISKRLPTRMPDANALLRPTLRMLVSDSMVSRIIQASGASHAIEGFLETLTPKHDERRPLPPEVVYDVLYEYCGDRAFHALDCLKGGRPNANHTMLALLLHTGYLDQLITTNFDICLEEAWMERSFFFRRLIPSWKTLRWLIPIWKIHGCITDPNSLITTFRRLGGKTFDQKFLGQLTNLLDNKIVVFLGYSGLDPDLIPAFTNAKMALVYWNVYEGVGKRPCNEPWRSIIGNGTEISWLLGDVYEDVLKPLGDLLGLAPPFVNGDVGVSAGTQQGVEGAIAHWEANSSIRMKSSEKLLSLLQLLYTRAAFNEDSGDIWWMLIAVADTAERILQSSGMLENDLLRDLHTFRSEAYLYLLDWKKAQDCLAAALKLDGTDLILIKALLNASVYLALAEPNGEAVERCLDTAFRLVRQLDRKKYDWHQMEARCFANQATINAQRGEFVLSYKSFKRAERLFVQAGDLYGYAGNAINRIRLSTKLSLRRDAARCFAEAKERLMGLTDEWLKKEFAKLESELPK